MNGSRRKARAKTSEHEPCFLHPIVALPMPCAREIAPGRMALGMGPAWLNLFHLLYRLSALHHDGPLHEGMVRAVVGIGAGFCQRQRERMAGSELT